MAELSPKQIIEISLNAIKPFTGDLTRLERAIGALVIGKKMGWKVLYLIHDKKTLKDYEGILGIQFREALPEVGELANKSIAWAALQGVKNFWKAVKGEIPGIRSPQAE